MSLESSNLGLFIPGDKIHINRKDFGCIGIGTIVIIIALFVIVGFDGSSMMIHLTFIIISKIVYVSVKKNLHKRKKEVEDKPNVHHLYVGSFGKIVGHDDEHRGDDKHAGEVDSDDSFKEEGFKVICVQSDSREQLETYIVKKTPSKRLPSVKETLTPFTPIL